MSNNYFGMNMNVFSLPELPLSEELTTVLAENENVRIERIISMGQVSADWYDQDETEFVVLLKGNCDDEAEQTEYMKMLVSKWANENNIQINIDMTEFTSSYVYDIISTIRLTSTQ